MDLLPTPHERAALLEGLACLIESRGFETFVRAPLLEPSSEFFPDPWEPSVRGVRALSLRLLRYAGLDAVDASVELFGEDQESGFGERRHDGTAAWFAGIEGDTCIFGADRKQLAVGDAIVGTMCHEIAHAYREHHDIVGAHRQLEEENTDITTVYLGFGILTTNNAYRFRKSGGLSGGMTTTAWSTSQVGYLSPQSMAFLLAAQSVARGLATRDVKRIAAKLEPNQRAFYRAAHRELGTDQDGLRLALGVPPVELWPDETVLAIPLLPADAHFVPGQAHDGDGDGDDHEKESAPLWNHASRVFRVRETKAKRWGLFGALLGMLVAAIVASRTELEGWRLCAYLMPVTLSLGVLAGRRRIRDACSEPRCEGLMTLADRATCPRCGAAIAGVIDDPNDRLELEDGLEDGRSVSAGLAALGARRRRGRVKLTVGVSIVTVLAALLMFSDDIPHPTTIGVLRSHHAMTLAAVRLTGHVVERLDEKGTLKSADGKELAAFLLDDGTGTLVIWYDLRQGTVRNGVHVRLWGRYESMNVRADDKVRFERELVASSLSVDD